MQFEYILFFEKAHLHIVNLYHQFSVFAHYVKHTYIANQTILGVQK